MIGLLWVPMGVSVEVFLDSADLQGGLRSLQSYLQDLSPARNRVAARLELVIDGYFEDQSGPKGRWADLQPVYLARKVAQGFDSRILHRTLAMREGIEVTATEGDGGLIEAVSGLDYSAAMHFGRSDAGIPARPFLDIDRPTEDDFVGIYLQQLEQAWENSTAGFS